MLRKRLEQATAPAREVAGLAAAVGTNFTLDLLTEASDLEADTVVEAVDELWRRRIMREFGDGYDFSHDMLREAAYAGISPPKRWLLHRRIAQGLELLHADDTDVVAAQLAEQYARGGRGDRALAYYRRAADVAAGRFAHAEAIRLHREALSIIEAMPAGRGRDAQELTVLEAMAAPLNARDGYSSPDLQRALEKVGGVVCGGAAIASEHLLIRHAVPLANLNINEFERPLVLVTTTADRDAPPPVHLEETILRCDEPLREEEIVLILRVDVGHAMPVAQHTQ